MPNAWAFLQQMMDCAARGEPMEFYPIDEHGNITGPPEVLFADDPRSPEARRAAAESN